MRRLFGVIIGGVVLAAAQALAFSPEALEVVDRNVTFIELQQNPDGFSGRNLLLGGTIIAIEKRRHGGMQLEIAQLPLTAANRPDGSFKPQGRFLATVPDELNLNEYRPGMRVAVLGTVKSGGRITVDDEELVYPVLSVREMELWPAGIIERRLPPREVVIYERAPDTVYVYEDRYPPPYYWPYSYGFWPFYPVWFGAGITIYDYPTHHYRPHFRGGEREGFRHDSGRGGSSIPARPQRFRR